MGQGSGGLSVCVTDLSSSQRQGLPFLNRRNPLLHLGPLLTSRDQRTRNGWTVKFNLYLTRPRGPLVAPDTCTQSPRIKESSQALSDTKKGLQPPAELLYGPAETCQAQRLPSQRPQRRENKCVPCEHT